MSVCRTILCSRCCKSFQILVNFQKSTNKHSSFGGLIQDIDLSDIYLAVPYSLFQNYRKGGEIGETDDDTATDSATDAINTSDDEGDKNFPELISKN